MLLSLAFNVVLSSISATRVTGAWARIVLGDSEVLDCASSPEMFSILRYLGTKIRFRVQANTSNRTNEKI